MTTLYVFGAGGGAVETIEDADLYRFNNFVFIEDNPISDKTSILGGIYDYELMSLNQFSEMVSYSDPREFCAIVTPVDVAYKKKIFKLFPDLDYIDCISKKAHIISVNTGIGFNARAFSFVGRTAVIGDFVKVNFHSTIPHDCNIGDYSFISHNVGLGARVNVGKGSYIYEGTTILPGITIGDNTIIGAGSLVTKDIPDNVVAYGLPCKVVRSND